MDPRERKLKALGVPEAASLVKAGLDTPRKIKAATDEQLQTVQGIGPSKRADIRNRFGRR